MKFGKIVHRVNTHRLTGSDFRFDVILWRRRPWRHFTQKSAAAWRANRKCLPASAAAPASVLDLSYTGTCYFCILLLYCIGAVFSKCIAVLYRLLYHTARVRCEQIYDRTNDVSGVVIQRW